MASDPYHISLSEFDIHPEALGNGAYSEIILATHRRDNQKYALKIVNKDKAQRHNNVKYFVNERRVMLMCNHPRIIQVRFSFLLLSKSSPNQPISFSEPYSLFHSPPLHYIVLYSSNGPQKMTKIFTSFTKLPQIVSSGSASAGFPHLHPHLFSAGSGSLKLQMQSNTSIWPTPLPTGT